MAFGLCQDVNNSLEEIGQVCILSGSGGLPIPFRVAKDMVNLIPDDWFSFESYLVDDVFDKDNYAQSHKVIDITCNSGVILEHFYYKFMHELSRVLPDDSEREDFILKDLLYAFCTSTKVVRLLRARFYWSYRCKGNIYHYNILSDTGTDRNRARSVLNNMKFDVVCGNPPYQNSNGGGSVYQDFGCRMYELAKKYMLLICPDRWNLSTQSNSFATFRKYLIENKSLFKLVHIASDGGKTFVFGNTGTKELTYLLADKDKTDVSCELVELDHIGKLINKGTISLGGTLYYSVDFISILNKIKSKCKNSLHGITELVTYDELDSRQFSSASPVMTATYNLKAYGSKGAVMYVNNSYFTHSYKAVPKWKTLLARNGVSSIVAEPDSVASRHLYMIRFDTQQEAYNCSNFCQTKLFRFLRSNSTAGMASSFESFKNLPLLDFTRSWSDSDLNSFFGFTTNEINFINSFTH